MRIASLLDKALAVTFGTAMAVAIIWSIFGPTKTEIPKEADKPKAAQRHEDLILMDAVRAVNADASSLMLSPFFSLSLSEPISCLLARSMMERPDATLPTLATIVSNQSRECEFSRSVRQFTLPVFHKIADLKALPKELYTFDAFRADTWVSVGLFDQAATCNLVQQQGTNQGMGTKVCTRWTPRF